MGWWEGAVSRAAKEDDGWAVLEQPKRAWGDGLREQRSWGYRGDREDISRTCWEIEKKEDGSQRGKKRKAWGRIGELAWVVGVANKPWDVWLAGSGEFFFWKKKLAGKEGEAKGGCFVNSLTALGLGTSLSLNILSHSLLIHEHGFGYLPWTSRATGLFWLNMFIHIWCSALSLSYSWSFLL